MAIFGGSSDLQIWHDGNHSHVADRGGTGVLYVESNDQVTVKQNDANTLSAVFNIGGDAELYHNGTKKFNTKSDGVTVIGDIGFGVAGNGIDFGANSHASGMSSEKFDSYEEGTWTPTISQGSATITAAGCNYTKIGRMVYLNFHANNFTDVSTNETIRITGLPFTPAQQNYGACSMVEMDHLGGGLASKVGNNGADLIFVVTNVNYSQTLVKYSSFDATTNFIGASIAYVV
jgi:hypothetical protein